MEENLRFCFVGSPAEGGETKKKMFISVDYMVVGGGISGLCIVQVLATEHGDAVPIFIVTEARDQVGGNIITVEKDGYAGAETRLRLERKDRLNCTVVLEKITKRVFIVKVGGIRLFNLVAI